MFLKNAWYETVQLVNSPLRKSTLGEEEEARKKEEERWWTLRGLRTSILYTVVASKIHPTISRNSNKIVSFLFSLA